MADDLGGQLRRSDASAHVFFFFMSVQVEGLRGPPAEGLRCRCPLPMPFPSGAAHGG